MAKSNIRAGHWTPNGLMIRNARGQSVIGHARSIGRTLGTFRAARYLAKRGWSLEAALWILCKSTRECDDVQNLSF